MIQEPTCTASPRAGRQYTFAHGNGPTATAAANSCHTKHTTNTHHRYMPCEIHTALHTSRGSRPAGQPYTHVCTHTQAGHTLLLLLWSDSIQPL